LSKRIKIRVNRPWVAYPGSPVQQNYGESLNHGYLLWDIEDKNHFDVKFCELPNPRPFVTLDWAGNVEDTIKLASPHPAGTRFRIRYKDAVLTQKEVSALMHQLQENQKASEVTFKNDHQIDKELISAGTATLVKDDLRNPDVLVRLLRDYHSNARVTDAEWEAVRGQVNHYLGRVLGSDDVVRNTKWRLRHLKWDNCFSYGEGNVINFDALNGIVGIFGPNRIGKSSVVGTIMYVLHNTSDRGSIKNLHVVNVRHDYAYARAIINSGGTDYVIERQTVKHEDRRGQQHANTHLNVFKVIDGGEMEDMGGEERKDTDRIIRKLIGTGEDALLTSVAAQDDIKQYINQGSTKRRQTVSRFLDLDIFDKMYDLAKDDVNVNKATLRSLPDRDWPEARRQLDLELERLAKAISDNDNEKHDIQQQLNDISREEMTFKDVIAVTPTEVEKQRSLLTSLREQGKQLESDISGLVSSITQKTRKVGSIDALLRENDVDELKKRLEAYKTLESAVDQLRVVHEKEAALLKQQQRSLKILDDVPCGDSFPTCRFIKDAHKVKDKVEPQKEKVDRALEKLDKAKEALFQLQREDLPNRVAKLQQLKNMRGELLTKLAEEQREHDKKMLKLNSDLAPRVKEVHQKLVELEEALKNEENVEVVALRHRKDKLMQQFRVADTERLNLATKQGRVQSDRDKLEKDRAQREELLALMKAHELIAQAFSRKGIPNLIITSQLPVINAEISKILTGIVDFNIELEVDNDSDSMEVYINYGDSRRPIELGSGMEKTVASIAIRVALINCSSLPKTDMFIIDEAFGPMDPASVEGCNRLLTSLKRYFKTIVVITHVEGVKDVADHIIEVNKVEKDAHVVYNESWPGDRTSATA
jgi:DNA repair exonuclease SbcCD ATPase subunit